MEFLRQCLQGNILRKMLLKVGRQLIYRFFRTQACLRAFVLYQLQLYSFNHFSELSEIHRLQNIIHDLKAQRLPAVFKFIIAAHYDTGAFPVLISDYPKSFQPRHNRNIDIHDNNIRLVQFGLVHSHYPVQGLTHHLTPICLPVKQSFKSFQDCHLVIHQHYLQRISHTGLPFFSLRKVP